MAQSSKGKRGKSGTSTVGTPPRKTARAKKPAVRRGTKKRPGRLLAHGCAFTSEIAEAIVGHLEGGDTRKIAAGRVGIGERTLQRWIARGRDNLEMVDASADDELGNPVEVDAYGAFLQRVISAESTKRSEILSKIDKQVADDWRAGAWLLERVDGREFGRGLKVEGIVRDEDGEEHSAADVLLDRLGEIIEREQSYMSRGGEAGDDDGG